MSGLYGLYMYMYIVYSAVYVHVSVLICLCTHAQLSTAADENGSFVQVMETFTSLAPILDMSVVDLDKQGQDVVRE